MIYNGGKWGRVENKTNPFLRKKNIFYACIKLEKPSRFRFPNGSDPVGLEPPCREYKEDFFDLK